MRAAATFVALTVAAIFGTSPARAADDLTDV